MQTTIERTDTRLHSADGVTWTFGPERIELQPMPQAANDGGLGLPSRAFPPETTAIIAGPPRAPGTAGLARASDWVLSFAPCSAQFIEPLMGWCGGSDPLRHVELRFPTREAAVRYAQRQGLRYEVCEPPRDRHAGNRRPWNAAQWTEWMLDILEPSSGVEQVDVEPAVLDPSRVFRDPGEVIRHPGLTTADKRRILKSWEWDALRIEATQDECTAEGEPSRLDEVRAALMVLDAPTASPASANTNIRHAPEAARIA